MPGAGGSRSGRSAAALGALIVVLWAAPALGGAWTVPASGFWGKVSWFRQTSSEWYIDSPEPQVIRTGGDVEFTQLPAGTRRPYRFGGEYRSKAVFAEGFYGVTDWLDLGVQVPWFDQVYRDTTRAEAPADAGFSDLRIFAKLRALRSPAVLTLKLGVKIPTGEFVNQDGLIPVGEGQWDFEVLVQAGRSFWPVPAYANLEAGYRLRMENRDVQRDPGDEWLVNAEAGWRPRPRLMLALKLEALHGRAGRSFGFENPSLKKRIVYLGPAVSWTLFGRTAAELALRRTLAGRNFPAGHQLALGLSARAGP